MLVLPLPMSSSYSTMSRVFLFFAISPLFTGCLCYGALNASKFELSIASVGWVGPTAGPSTCDFKATYRFERLDRALRS